MEKLVVADSRDIPKDFTGIAEFSNKLKHWYKEGKLHREDGPAIECPDGTKEWYKEGSIHREDGPAVEHEDGRKEWWVCNHRHRLDGPAIINPYGIKEFWIDGVRYYEIIDITNKLFLGKEKGKYDLDWLKFLTEQGIKEYPIISGMKYEFSKKYTLEELISTEK